MQQTPHPPPQGQHFTSLSAVCLVSDTAICQMFRGTWPQGKRYLGTRNSEAGPFPRKRETEGKINPGTESRIHVYPCAGSRIRSLRLGQTADRSSRREQRIWKLLRSREPRRWSCLASSRDLPTPLSPLPEGLLITVPAVASHKTPNC